MHTIRSIKKQLRKLQDVIIVKELSLTIFLQTNTVNIVKKVKQYVLNSIHIDLKIRRIVKRVGINEESQVQVKELINSSKIVCANCWLN